MKYGFVLLVLLFVPPSAAAACAVGPRTYDFADPGANDYHGTKRLSYFIGKVREISIDAGNAEAMVTIDVLRDYGVTQQQGLRDVVTAVASFGNHPGGCGEVLKVGQAGKFAVYFDNGKAVLVSTNWSF